MKDSVVRGRLLQLLYERRNEGALPFGAAEGAIAPPAGISQRDWLQALAQLVEYGLVSWVSPENKTGTSGMSGSAQINEHGVDVREGRETPQLEIRFT